MRAIIVSFVLFVTASLSGCAGNLAGFGAIGAPTFDRMQQQTAQSVQHGVVIQVREVKIDAQPGAGIQGAIAGAPVGFLVSQLFRKSSVGTQVGVGTAVSLVGTAIGNVASSARGLQAIVRMDNGSVISVAQPMEQGNPIRPGDKVLLVGNGRLVLSSY